MPKYHVNDAGEPGVCRARTRPCKFGGASGTEAHFDSREAAVEESHRRFEQEFSAVPAKHGVNDSPAVDNFVQPDGTMTGEKTARQVFEVMTKILGAESHYTDANGEQKKEDPYGMMFHLRKPGGYNGGSMEWTEHGAGFRFYSYARGGESGAAGLCKIDVVDYGWHPEESHFKVRLKKAQEALDKILGYDRSRGF